MEISTLVLAVARAMDEIHKCIQDQSSPDPEIKFGSLLGEMDWRWELHHLLFNQGQ